MKTVLINCTATEAIEFWEREKAEEAALVNENQTSLPHLSNPRPSTLVRWIDSGRCDFTFHYFARDEAGNLQGFHGDESVCESIEFNLKAEAA